MDQAKKLRELMNNLENNKKEESSDKNEEEIDMDSTNGRVISISSGKGGVGKTNFAINFSIALRRKGYKVLIIDADIGLGNVEILSGSDIKYSISDMVFSDKTIDDIMGEGPEGLKIISGGSGIKELILLDEANFKIIMEELKKIQNKFDYIIIDTGAGISPAVLDFVMASDEVIVIGTPDPTSVMDAYVLIKSIIINDFPGKINLVSNLVKNNSQGKDIYYKINNASEKFLKTDINYLGYILKDEKVSEAVGKQIPFIMAYPRRVISRQIVDITDNIITGKEDIHKEKVGFAEKLMNIFIN